MSDPKLLHTVKVFGSAVIRVAPDSATIVVAVSRLEPKAKDAFAKASRGAEAVHAYLQKAGLKDFGASRVTLSAQFHFVGGERRFQGYQARIGYNVILRDLDHVEEILTGLIDAGANELTSVEFQTTQLREIRAEARRRAVAAALEKAGVYCRAAGVSLGPVAAIEDANPETLSGRQEGHTQREPGPDDVGELKAIDPGAIAVGAAVYLVCALNP